MGKSEFIFRLQEELRMLPSEERENAIKYYREYFDDAGVENEQKVLDELEAPEVIAKGIKEDLGFASDNNMPKNVVDSKIDPNFKHADANNNKEQANKSDFANRKINVGNMSVPVWALILIAVFLSPILLPIISGLFGTIIGIIFAIIGITIGFFGAAIGLLVGGVASVVWGISTIITGVYINGVLLIGLGLFLIGLGLVFLSLSMQFFVVWIPQLVKWIIHTVKNGFKHSSVKKGALA